jgi:hypothetical protein
MLHRHPLPRTRFRRCECPKWKNWPLGSIGAMTQQTAPRASSALPTGNLADTGCYSRAAQGCFSFLRLVAGARVAVRVENSIEKPGLSDATFIFRRPHSQPRVVATPHSLTAENSSSSTCYILHLRCAKVALPRSCALTDAEMPSCTAGSPS